MEPNHTLNLKKRESMEPNPIFRLKKEDFMELQNQNSSTEADGLEETKDNIVSNIQNSPTEIEGLEEAKDNIINDITDDEIIRNEQRDVNQNRGEIVNRSLEDGAIFERNRDSQVEIFKPGIEAVEKYFGDEAAKHVESELARIDGIEDETIYALEKRGESNNHVKDLVSTLGTYGVNADSLTVAEAEAVETFATDESPETIKEKTYSIYDAVIRHINGVRSRHDGAEPAFYNSEERAKKARIQEKFVQWDEGELDTERGFDIKDVYARLIREGEEPSAYLKGQLKNDDIETLLDLGYIEEDDLYVYGPFKEEDIRDIEVFNKKTWTTMTDQRYFNKPRLKKKTIIGPDGKRRRITIGETIHSDGGLSSLISKMVTGNGSHASIENGLVQNYIATEIVQNRRLPAKDLLTISAALSLDLLDSDDDDTNIATTDREKEEQDGIRRTISWLAYYTGKILGYRAEELKSRFDSTRPIDKEFFKEVAEATKNMSEERAAYLNKSFKSYLTKMDEHLHDLQDRSAAASSEQTDLLFSEDLD